MRTPALLIAVLTSLPMLLMPVAVHADERADLEQLRDTVTDMVEALVASGALSRAKADQLLARSRARAGVAAATAPAATSRGRGAGWSGRKAALSGDGGDQQVAS